MQYLLDTHAFLWFVSGDSQLSEKARKHIEDQNSDHFVSIISFWEMAIKLNLGKLNLDISFHDLYNEVEKNGFNLLPITLQHTEKILDLELHHRDPFERMLISQSIVDGLTIVSKDANFSHYPVNQIW